MDNFNGERCSVWKFKTEMVLASLDLWNITDESKKALPSNTDLKVVQEGQKYVKNVMSIIISLNLAGKPTFAHQEL